MLLSGDCTNCVTPRPRIEADDHTSIEVWVLMLWTIISAPIEAGQYQTKERCEQSAKMQRPAYAIEMRVRNAFHRCSLERR